MRAFAFVLAISLGTMSEAAPRVASLNLCTDELLLALADPAQIVSVTHLAQDRRETPRWRQARRYAANDGSILAVARHRPTLIVTMGGGGRDSARLAAALGARFVNLPFPTQIADVEQSILTLSVAIGRSERGRSLIRQIRAARQSAPHRLRDAIFVDRGARSLGPAGAGAEWLALAGYRQLGLPGDRIDREALMRMKPLTLLVSSYRSDQYSRAASLPVRRPQDRLVRADGRRWTCMGPDMLPEIARLRQR